MGRGTDWVKTKRARLRRMDAHAQRLEKAAREATDRFRTREESKAEMRARGERALAEFAARRP